MAIDDIETRTFVGRVLGERYSVEAVSDGQTALEAIGRPGRAPELVVIARMTPPLDGLGLLRALRSRAGTCGIPVLLLSDPDQEDWRIAGLESGANDHLVMPFGAPELLARVACQLRGVQRRAEVASGEQELRLEAEKGRQALQESETRFRTFVRRSRDGIIIVDGSGTIVEWNEGEEQLTGIPRAQALHRPIWEVQLQLAPEERRNDDYLRLAREKALAGLAEGVNLERTIEEEIQRPDGTRRTIQSILFGVQSDGKLYVGGICRDFTDRKQIEERLRQSEERLALAIEASGQGLWDWDIAADTAYLSPEYLRITGHSNPNVHSALAFFRDLIHPDDLPGVDKAMGEHFRGESARSVIEYRIRRNAGDCRWIRGIGRISARDASGAPTRMTGIIADVTASKRLEEDLRERQALLLEAERLANLGHWDRDLRSGQSYWSAEVYRILGYEPGSVVPSHEAFLQAFDPADRERIGDAVSATARDGVMRRGEYRVVAPGGAPRHVIGTVELLRDASGPARIIGTAQDITERRRVEEALRETAARLHLALQAAGAGVWEWDVRTNENTWSEEVWTLYGLEPHSCEPSYDTWFRTIVPEDQARVERAVHEAASRGATLNADWRVRSRDGAARWLMSQGQPAVQDGDGRVVRYMGIVVDVTALKQAEQERERLLAAVRESEKQVSVDLDAMTRLQKLGSLFLVEGTLESVLDEIVGAAIAISGADFGTIQIRDPKTSSLKIAAQRGFQKWWLDYWDREGEGQGSRGTALEHGRRVIVEDIEESPVFVRTEALEVQRKAGVRAVQSTPLLSRSGRLIGMVSTHWRAPGRPADHTLRLLDLLARQAADILDRAEAEDALREAHRQLAESDRRKNEFLAMLSHELRNPLAPIRNSLYILDRAAPGGEQARRAQAVIDRQVGHMTRLIDDLLDVTRITRGKALLQRERLDLCELARRTVEDHRGAFVEGDVELRVTTSPAELWVNGDRTRLAQVFGNLLQNAAKFTPRGGTTTVSVEADAARRRAIVRVKDSGRGITPDVMPRLFEAFTQADNTLDRRKGGLGLGLALVKGLVEMHGGEVSAASDGAGKGATFTVVLPLEMPISTGPNPSHTETVISARRVLVIEDNADAANSLREALELAGHEVEVAHDGPEGLRKARSFAPEVVLCDIGLPEMDGYEVAQAIRADAELSRVMLVALTGYAGPDDVAKARAAGFDAHLAKPPNLEKLEGVLAGRSNEGRPEPRPPAP